MKEENRLWNEIKHRDVSTEFKNITGGGGKAQRHAKGGISSVGPPFWELLQVTKQGLAQTNTRRSSAQGWARKPSRIQRRKTKTTAV